MSDPIERREFEFHVSSLREDVRAQTAALKELVTETRDLVREQNGKVVAAAVRISVLEAQSANNKDWVARAFSIAGLLLAALFGLWKRV